MVGFLKRDHRIGPTNERLMESVAGEVDPWRQILGKKRLKRIGVHILSVANRVYPFPRKSNRL